MAQIISTTILYWLLQSIAFQKLTIAEDTLVRNQSIGLGQILVSQNQVFEMGFFSPGKSLNRFLGIWYKSTPDVVVWVANRNHPITASQTPLFMISGNGSLVISNGKSIIWSASSSGVATYPVLHLLDSGNLVLVNETTEGGYLWQSFDSPTDTFLPGMKLIDDAESGEQRYLTSWRNADDPSPGDFSVRMESHGLPEMVIFKGEKKRYRNGKWNGIFFSGVPRPQIPIHLFHPNTIFREERMISMIQPYDKSVLIRVTIYSSGLFLRYVMNAHRGKWNLVFTHPQDTCDEYGACGPNGVCNVDKPIRCHCLKGFAPASPKDWDLQDWTGGCRRVGALNCEGGDGFHEVRGVKHPDMLQFWLNMSMSLGECRAECLRNCSCISYANPYITDGGSGCVMWFGDLIDTRELPAADRRQNIYIRLPISGLGRSV